MQRKIKCWNCGKRKPNHNRVKLVVDDTVIFICEDCMDVQREAMLNDEHHPAWQYYTALKQALFGDEKLR